MKKVYLHTVIARDSDGCLLISLIAAADGIAVNVVGGGNPGATKDDCSNGARGLADSTAMLLALLQPKTMASQPRFVPPQSFERCRCRRESSGMGQDFAKSPAICINRITVCTQKHTTYAGVISR